MERILVIGCPGAGKTTLSRQLGEKLDFPVIHLDKIFWSPGNWEHLDDGAFDEALEKELERHQWIIEGNYNRTLLLRLQYCDTVIWLDYSRFVCMAGWFKRMLTNWGKVRPDMAPGCVERYEREFAGFIWNFNKEKRSKYVTLLAAQEGKKIYRFKNRRMAKKFIDKL